jgi:hypothetical protein
MPPSDSPESLDYLAGMYLPGGGNYDWLHGREPVARMGYHLPV